MTRLGVMRRLDSRLPQRAIPLALMVVLMAPACSSDEEGAPSGSGEDPAAGAVLETTDGTIVLVAGGQGGSGDAAIAGTVAVVNGCLGLRIGTSAYTAIWPEGTTVKEDDPVSISLPGGEAVGNGSKVDGAGGFLTGELPSWAPAIPESCDASAEIAVMSQARAP